VIHKESAHPCFDCARCCTYVALEIDAPTTNKEYDYLVWYLFHPGVSVFVDWEGSWFVKFESRCRHLTEHGLCGVYEHRPAICRDFDWRDCEMHVKDEPPDKHLFESAEAFLAWLEGQRPKAWKRFQAWKREKKRTKTDPALRRVRITERTAPLPR
jgi:Fe-S-cluster containining protein